MKFKILLLAYALTISGYSQTRFENPNAKHRAQGTSGTAIYQSSSSIYLNPAFSSQLRYRTHSTLLLGTSWNPKYDYSTDRYQSVLHSIGLFNGKINLGYGIFERNVFPDTLPLVLIDSVYVQPITRINKHQALGLNLSLALKEYAAFGINLKRIEAEFPIIFESYSDYDDIWTIDFGGYLSYPYLIKSIGLKISPSYGIAHINHDAVFEFEVLSASGEFFVPIYTSWNQAIGIEVNYLDLLSYSFTMETHYDERDTSDALANFFSYISLMEFKDITAHTLKLTPFLELRIAKAIQLDEVQYLSGTTYVLDVRDIFESYYRIKKGYWGFSKGLIFDKYLKFKLFGNAHHPSVRLEFTQTSNSVHFWKTDGQSQIGIEIHM